MKLITLFLGLIFAGFFLLLLKVKKEDKNKGRGSACKDEGCDCDEGGCHRERVSIETSHHDHYFE